jgi:hypothetical protein
MIINKVTLTNKIRVANFDSPHDFIFEDGSVLKGYEKTAFDVSHMYYEEIEIRRVNKATLINVVPCLTEAGILRIMLFILAYRKGDIDYVIAPRPVIEAMKNMASNYPKEAAIKFFVTGKLKDRYEKILHTDKFCVV